MKLKDTPLSCKVFNKQQKIALNYVDARAVLLEQKPENRSVVDAYIASVVLKNATVHLHSLETLQNESRDRLKYKYVDDWQNTLWERLTWHDVVVWMMLLDLTDKFGYHPQENEIGMMKAIHETCRVRDDKRYKFIYGMLCLPLPKSR